MAGVGAGSGAGGWRASTLRSAHAFTGVAAGDFGVRAIGRDAASARLVGSLGGVGALRVVSQVHGAGVVGVEDVAPGVEADAIVSGEPGAVVAVRVADCVPILLEADGVVAAVHAGWRGTAADIARAALSVVRARAGAARGGPAEVRAAIGPSIGGVCYEVGPEVIAALAALGGAALVAESRWRADRRVDLRAFNAALLASEGVAVEVSDSCTRCTPGYWSHRRDGADAGRQVGAIRA